MNIEQPTNKFRVHITLMLRITPFTTLTKYPFLG